MTKLPPSNQAWMPYHDWSDYITKEENTIRNHEVENWLNEVYTNEKMLAKVRFKGEAAGLINQFRKD